jgi:hypothetical protein
MRNEEFEEWTKLQNLLRDVTISNEEDNIIWDLGSSKKFTTSSLYKFMTYGGGGVNCKMEGKIWKCKVPLKIRIFIWQAFQNRLQTAQQLKDLKWKGSEFCSLCGESEDVNHLLFTCPVTEFVWCCISEGLGWKGYPRSLIELISDWIPKRLGVSFELGLSCFAGFAWVLWLTRNKMCISKRFPDKPFDIIYLSLSFIQIGES